MGVSHYRTNLYVVLLYRKRHSQEKPTATTTNGARKHCHKKLKKPEQDILLLPMSFTVSVAQNEHPPHPQKNHQKVYGGTAATTAFKQSRIHLLELHENSNKGFQPLGAQDVIENTQFKLGVSSINT